MALDVEEVRGLQMAVAVLLAGVDGGDVDAAFEHGGVAGGVDLALKAAEAAAYGRDAHVTDLETDVRVRRIDVVDAGRDALEVGDGG